MQLYMTELSVGDWDAAVGWFRGVLGLPEILLDAGRRFALLGDDWGRLALKAGPPAGVGAQPRLAFLVDDLDATRSRLIASGASVTDATRDGREPFRSFRVEGPEGTPITVFAWSDQTATSGRT